MAVILSYIQTRPLLEARKHGQVVVETSLDLGMTTSSVTLITEGVTFPGGEQLDWSSIEKISQDTVSCYIISVKGMQAVQTFSEATNRLCSLLPTRGAPSMLIAGFVMHRIKELDPWQHAQRMIASLAPVSGSVLEHGDGPGLYGHPGCQSR